MRGPGRQPVRGRRHLPVAGPRRRAPAAARAPRRGARAARGAGGRGGRRRRSAPTRRAVRAGARARPASRASGTTARWPRDARGDPPSRRPAGATATPPARRVSAAVSATELVALVCCDLGAIVRGRSLLASELDDAAATPASAGCRPTTRSRRSARSPSRNPFGSTGDLRLLPDPDTRVRVEARARRGRRWSSCCATSSRPTASRGSAVRGSFLRDALERARARARPARWWRASSTSSSSLPTRRPAAAVLAGGAAPRRTVRRRGRWARWSKPACSRSASSPSSRRTSSRSPWQPAEGRRGADRSVVLSEVVREVARRHGLRASFAPLLDPAGPGNGVHIHLSLLDAAGRPLLYDAARPACLSELGGRFAAGILLHARALSALTAPEPGLGRAPDAPPLERGRGLPGPSATAKRCCASRRWSRSPATDPAAQLRLEYRGADAAANPYLALGAIVRAGLEGVRAGLPAPPILDRDPAQLDAAEAERYGVGALPASLEDSLRALAEDETARAWMAPLLYDAYVGVKRAELEAVAGPGRRARCAGAMPRSTDRSLLAARAAARWHRARAAARGRAAPPPARPARAGAPEERRPPRRRRGAPGRVRRRSPAPGGSPASGPPSGAAVAVRAELDGLPIEERTGAPFSARGDAMHACGHDVHMAALVALARAAHALGEQLPAPLLAVFQPSEEAYPSGAEQLARGELARARAGGGGRGARASRAAVGRGRARPGRGQRVVRHRRDHRRGRADARGLPAPRARPDPRARADRRRAPRRRSAGGSIRSRPATLTVGVLEGGSAENVIPARARARAALRAHRPGGPPRAARDGRRRSSPGSPRPTAAAASVELVAGRAGARERPRDRRARRASCSASAGLDAAPRSGARAARTTSPSSARWRRSRWASWASTAPRASAARPLHHPELLPPDSAVGAVARVQAVLYLAAATAAGR